METTPRKMHTRNPLKIYLLLMTLIGVIGTIVSLGIVIVSVGEKLIISNEEYIIGERYYELENCKYNDYDGKESTKATAAEIKTCETEKREVLIKSRQVDFKQNTLDGGIRSIVFIILLSIHYPKFMRLTKKSEE